MRLRLLPLVTAAALAASLAGPGAPAQAADPRTFQPSGTTVAPSSATGSAPVLEPGSYAVQLPADTTKRYVKVSRASAAEGLSVTVTGQATESGQAQLTTQEHSLQVSVATPDGDSCGSTGNDQLSKDYPLNLLLSASVRIDPDGTERQSFLSENCQTATDFVVSITREEPGGPAVMPAEIHVLRQPKTTSDPGSGGSTDFSPVRAEPRDGGTEVRPGRGFGDAPTLAAGTVPLDLTVGDVAFYKVRVGYGQRLAASVELPRNGSSFAPPYQMDAEVTIFSPAHVPLDPSSSEVSSRTSVLAKSGEAEIIGSYTPTVRYANRNLTFSTAPDYGATAASADAAGWYYVGIRVSAGEPEDRAAAFPPVPARVSVQVSGTAVAGPTFVSAQGVALQEPASGAASTQGGDSSGWSIAAWKIAVGALALVLAALACLWALRARRRTSD